MRLLSLWICLGLFLACQPVAKEATPPTPSRLRVVLDTDANNELDDQHAIAYMLFNQDVFEIEGITVNATYNGGKIDEHVAEARRVMALCGMAEAVPVQAGASDPYAQTVQQLDQPDFDGHAAVNFIIERAMAESDRPLILVPIGSLTNIALALAKEPRIASRVRVVWLGSNWPGPGEYNLDNDTTAVNPLLEATDLPFEICTVRYSETTGTAAVTASIDEIRREMAGKGPQVDPVPGRAGGNFTCFGDYSIDLYKHIGDSVRSLFDVCALAILKEPSWAKAKVVPAPQLIGNAWEARPQNPRRVTFYEHFDREGILADFYATMRRHTPKP